MITVHHLEYSQSFRVVWLLEELGMDYDLKIYKRDQNHMAPPEFKEISPLGTAPLITDDNGIVLCESNAIVDYILDKTGGEQKLRPPPPDRSSYLFWFHASQGSLMPLMLIDSLLRIIPKRVPWILKFLLTAVFRKVLATWLVPRLQKILELAEQNLGESPFIAGTQLTAADISLIYPMESAASRQADVFDAYPNCKAWLERMYERPKFKAAQAKVGQDHVVIGLE